MTTDTTTLESRIATQNLCTEDPLREPHEKETALHIDGDETHATVTSFKKVVFEKWLRHPEFEVTHLTVQDADGSQGVVKSLEIVQENPDLRVIGAVGTFPIGCVSIGASRNSNSHADIVKPGGLRAASSGQRGG